jgi:hypothetical protein
MRIQTYKIIKNVDGAVAAVKVFVFFYRLRNATVVAFCDVDDFSFDLRVKAT